MYSFDRLDRFFEATEGTPEYLAARLDYRLFRHRYRQLARTSSTTLPAVADGTQHFVAARDHLTAGLDAIGGITRGRSEPPEPEE